MDKIVNIDIPHLPSFFNLSLSRDKVTCSVRQNSSQPIPGIDIYQGIPNNLVLNIIVCFLLLICFTILRKVAWDYGRIALISRNDDPERNDSLEQNVTGSETVSKLKWADNCLWICTFFRLTDAKIVQRCGRDTYIYFLFQRYLIVYVSLISLLSLIIIVPINLNGNYFSSLSDFGSLTIANSNTQYLWMHSVMAFLYFLLAVVFMQRFSYCLKSIQTKMEQAGEYEQNGMASKTLMVSNIKNPNEESIREYFTNRYSKESIVDIQLTYNVAALTKMDAKRKLATKARLNLEREYLLKNQDENKDLNIYPYPCSWFCSCCFCEACGCHKVNAVKFYTELEEKLRLDIEEEKTRIRSKPLGIVFVTLIDSDTAERVCNDYRYNWRNLYRNLVENREYLGTAHSVGRDIYHKYRNRNRNNNVSNTDPENTDPENTDPENISLKNTDSKNTDSENTDSENTAPKITGPEIITKTSSWGVQFAPSVNNVIWENLNRSGYKWFLKANFLNLSISVFSFFFTTPAIFLGKLERLFHIKISSVFGEFLPSVLLLSMSSFLPMLVHSANRSIGHWTRCSEYQSDMIKTFLLLIETVIVLPSLGLTSIHGIFQRRFIEHTQCIFASDNIVFFVNYVVTSAFIGTAVELLRLSELFSYGIRIMLTRSPAERSTVREVKVSDFHFGFQYAWLFCITAVILAYSVPCPLITLAGVIFLIAKHAVDRYNIYFAYRPLSVNIDLHTSAGNLFVATAILIPGCIFVFILLRFSYSQTPMLEAILIFALILLIISLLVFVDHVRFGKLKRLVYILFDKYWTWTIPEIPETRNVEKSTLYVANVLQESENSTSESNLSLPSKITNGLFVNC